MTCPRGWPHHEARSGSSTIMPTRLGSVGSENSSRPKRSSASSVRARAISGVGPPAARSILRAGAWPAVLRGLGSGAPPPSGVAFGGRLADMIVGAHSIIYAEDAERTRAFFRDVLGYPYVDAHGGWLIFKLPPGELGIHPVDAEGKIGRAH